LAESRAKEATGGTLRKQRNELRAGVTKKKRHEFYERNE
jgi:hypothetical protein